MKSNLYSASVVVFDRGLTGLSAILRRGAEYAADNEIDPLELLQSRLHPSMFPLYRQAQIVCDFAWQSPARIAGLDVPPYLAGEANFAELQTQVAATKKFLGSLSPAQFEGRDGIMVTFPVGTEEMTYPAVQYLLGFATQNFFFHLVTAYGILRHVGVDLGKKDYFGS